MSFRPARDAVYPVLRGASGLDWLPEQWDNQLAAMLFWTCPIPIGELSAPIGAAAPGTVDYLLGRRRRLLFRRRVTPTYCAFDVLWLNRDLRNDRC